MAPELSRVEEDRLIQMAGRHGVFCASANPEIQFLAEILLRTIRAMEREDDYQREQRERS